MDSYPFGCQRLFSIYSQLPFILETVPSSSSSVRARLWWHGPTYHGYDAWIVALFEWKGKLIKENGFEVPIPLVKLHKNKGLTVADDSAANILSALERCYIGLCLGAWIILLISTDFFIIPSRNVGITTLNYSTGASSLSKFPTRCSIVSKAENVITKEMKPGNQLQHYSSMCYIRSL